MEWEREEDGTENEWGRGERRQVSPGDAVTRKLWAGPEMLRWTLWGQGGRDRLPEAGRGPGQTRHGSPLEPAGELGGGRQKNHDGQGVACRFY